MALPLATASSALPGPPTPPVRCRVVIVDDHASIVGMMARVVEAIPGYKVVGSATDAASARELCRKLQPDLVVLDLVLPHVSGLSLYTELRTACARARFLIYSGQLRAPAVKEALLAGAQGLVEKSASLEELCDAIRAVGSGQSYFSRRSSETIRLMISKDPAQPVRAPRLSDREKSVLRALAEGCSSKEIADRLRISIHTVVNHRTRLARKTGLRGVAQLARYAVQIGLVEDGLDPPL
jgi:DNA-binding NarL/FixJ family response regulator